MNPTHKLPKITKDVERDVERLLKLYEYEEFTSAQYVAQDVWDRARAIYSSFPSKHPYYILFMVKEVSQKMQKFACEFLVCRAKNTGEIIPNSLVWYCNPQKGIFKLDTKICDLGRKESTTN